MATGEQPRAWLRTFSGGISLVLGVGTLYATWGSLPLFTAPLIDCEIVPAGRPTLTADWTIEYYNKCHAHDDAYLLLGVLTISSIVLIANGYLVLSDASSDA